MEDWNQPRYWSPPSKYTSAGYWRLSRWPATAAQVEPESNHTSMISFSLEKRPLPHLGQARPAGTSSSAVRSNHTLEPCSRNSPATWEMVSGVTMASPQSSQ